MKRKAPIGFLDSGAGGISVMLACRKLLPYENFILYGDSANAPYGEKSEEEIKRLALAAAEKLLEEYKGAGYRLQYYNDNSRRAVLLPP